MSLVSDTPDGAHAARFPTGETIRDNKHWNDRNAELSVAIPTYRDNAVALLDALGRCSDASRIEILLFDDGGADVDLQARHKTAIDTLDCPARFIISETNLGRSGGRNRLAHHARADWILLLDADMLPDSADFLSTYLRHIDRHPTPGLAVGGFSLKQSPTDRRFALHHWQAAGSECVPAPVRQSEPGRYVFTSNVLVHRSILASHPFDESFLGWGWEDVDWGLRIAAVAPVHHLDNSATHLGLDDARTLMNKYGRSGRNFALALSKHPEALGGTPAARAARMLRRLPLIARRALKSATGAIVLFEPPRFPFALPTSWRGRALKLWRALVYAEALT